MALSWLLSVLSVMRPILRLSSLKRMVSHSTSQYMITSRHFPPIIDSV